jgi:hypothetical protein
MATMIQPEWCPGEEQEISVDLVETDWRSGSCIDYGQEVPVSRDRDSGLWFRDSHPRRIESRLYIEVLPPE